MITVDITSEFQIYRKEMSSKKMITYKSAIHQRWAEVHFRGLHYYICSFSKLRHKAHQQVWKC